jgi:flagellar protein FlgJ
MEITNNIFMDQMQFHLIEKNLNFLPLASGNQKTVALPADESTRFFPLSKVNGKGTGKADAAKNDKRLKEECANFEAVLTNLLMAEMKKTVKKNGFFGGDSFASESFHSLLDSETAKNIAKSGCLGIAESLYNQLSNTTSFGVED